MNNHLIPPELVNITADLLELASDEFSNNGCNDHYLENTPKNRKFVKNMNKWADNLWEDKEEIEITKDGILTTDWLIMDYCAHLLRNPSGD